MSKNQNPPVYNNVAKVLKPLNFIRSRTSVKNKEGIWELSPIGRKASHAANKGNGAFVQSIARQLANAPA